MFTVIIPLFNKAPYIQRALDSVLAQSWPADEIIVVNDGSTDGGERIAREQRDPRVRVIDQPNQGVSVARNVGIAAATQPYVAFLDADDEWLPGFFERIREMIGRFPGAGLYGTGFATVAGGRELQRYGVRPRDLLRCARAGCRNEERWPCREDANERPAFGPVDFFYVWARGHVIHTSSMVVPRHVAQAVGGFPAGVAICEDHEFWAKIALARPVVLAPQALTRYDVGVPGQAVEYWDQGYKKTFEVLPYHRFLAEELREVLKCGSSKVRELVNAETGSHEHANALTNELLAVSSFRIYCRKEFQKALLQRLYWGNFGALARFYQELGLGELKLGMLVRVCGWVSDHPAVHPAMCYLLKALRWVRDLMQPQRAQSTQR